MNIRTPYTAFMTTALIFTVACLGAWGFLVYKSYGLKAALADLSAQAESAASRDARMLDLKAALRDSRDSVAAIESHFVTKDGIPEFIDMLETKAGSAGLKASVGSINLDESGDPAALKTLGVKVSGTGEWKNIAGFVSLVEALPFALKIDNLVISKSNGAWSFSLDLAAQVMLTSSEQ